MRALGLGPSLGTCLWYRLRARHEHLGFPLSDAGSLAGEVAQVVQLGATDASAADDDDRRDHRAVDGENALDADAIGDLPDCEGRAHSAAALGDADTLESLDSFLVALAHAHVDAECVTGPERGDIVAEPLFLGFDEGMHMALGAGVNSLVKTCLVDSRVATKSKPSTGSMPVNSSCSSNQARRSSQPSRGSERRLRVSLAPSSSRHLAILAWSPDSKTSGTACPRNSGGRV